MANLSKWFTELLFAVAHLAYCLTSSADYSQAPTQSAVKKRDTTWPTIHPHFKPFFNKSPRPPWPSNPLTVPPTTPPPTTPRPTTPPPTTPRPTTPPPTTPPPTTPPPTTPPSTAPPTPPPTICDLKKIESEKDLLADCTNKKLTSIPKDLGANNNARIKVLNLSNNDLKNLTDTDLTNYTQLIELIMVNIPSIKSFPPKFFSPTLFLEKLDISGTPITDFAPISTFLYVLNATNIQANYVNVSHLVTLKELYLKDNSKLKDFPLLSKTAPLTHIDVRYCSMANLTYPDLAPFCLLQYFGLESTDLQNAPNITQCCSIKNWTTFFEIPGAENQKCGSDDFCKKVNHTLELKVIGVRNECLKRTGFFAYVTTLIEIFFGVVVASGVIYFICINSLLKRRKQYYYDDYDSGGYDYYDDADQSDDYDQDYDEEEYDYYY